MSDTHEVEVNKDNCLSSDMDVNSQQTKASLADKAKVRKQKNLATQIDESAEFYFLYGLLDGISVSYSTLKFLCEIFTTATSSDYGEALETALSDPEWLILVVSGSVLITGISALANYFDKTEKKALDPSQAKKDTKKNWEYIRDILKGAKNSYKGTKGFIAMFLMLEVLNYEQFLSIIFPLGLVMAAVSIMNRCWSRNLTDGRDKRQKNCQKAIGKVDRLNAFLQKKQDLKNQLFALELRVKRAEAVEAEIKSLEQDVNQLTPKIQALPETTVAELKPFALTKEKSKSMPELTSDKTRQRTIRKLSELQNKKIELLTAPKVQEYLREINELKNHIQTEQAAGRLPKESKANVLHPLVLKLKLKQKELIQLQKDPKETQILTIKGLKEKVVEQKQELERHIKHQKRQDTLSLTESLANEQKYLKTLRPELADRINEWSDEAQKLFFEHISENYKEITSCEKSLERLKKQEKEEEEKSKDGLDKKIKNDFEQQAEELKRKKRAYIEQLYDFYLDHSITPDEINNFDADFTFSELTAEEEELSSYRDQTKNKLLLSKVIGAVADAPYLYAGILGIVLISPPAILWFLVGSIITFTATAIVTRRNEEVEEDRNCQQLLLESQLSKLHNEWKAAQNKYYKASRKLSNHLKEKDSSDVLGPEFEHLSPSEKEEMLFERRKRLAIAELQYVHEKRLAKSELFEAYNKTRAKQQELKDLLMPSYSSAVINGLKDGITLFGAIASLFYAVDIILLLAGSTFPPILIVAAVVVGLASMIGFTAYRLNHTRNVQKEFDASFPIEEINEEEFQDDKPSLPLGMADCNTDGLTKGELYNQENHEMLRILGSTAGKSQNLYNFTLSRTELGSLPLIMLVSFSTFLYSSVLLLRGYAKAFKNRPETSPDGNQEEKDKSLSEKSIEEPEAFDSNQPPSKNTSEQHSADESTSFKSLGSSTSPTFFSLSSRITPSPTPTEEEQTKQRNARRGSPQLFYAAPSPTETVDPKTVRFAPSPTS